MSTGRAGRGALAALVLTAAAALGACASLPSPAPPETPVATPAGRPVAPTPAPAASRGYRAVVPAEGDTLSSLAAAHLGDSGKDWVIARFNGVASAEPGRALVIPPEPFDRGGLWGTRYQTVPVLSYHKISESTADAMTVRRRDFERQMQLLAEKGYRVVTLDELYDFLDFRAGLPEKSVVITFDDGWRSVYDLAMPILRRHGYRATIFVSTGMITGSSTTLSWEQLREMAAQGFDIQGHTVDHRSLDAPKEGESPEAYLADLERELTRSARVIEEKTGSRVRYLAYPYGKTSPLVATLLRRLGYRGALTVHRGGNPFFIDNYRINRSMIYGTYDLAAFEKNLAVAGRRALQ